MPFYIGPTLSVQGEKEFTAAMEGIRKQMSYVKAAANEATSVFDKNDKSVKALTTRNTELKKAMTLQKKAVKEAQDALKRMKEAGVDPSTDAYKRMEANVANVKAALNKTKLEINENVKAMDGFDDEMRETSKSFDEIKNGLAKIGITAVSAKAVFQFFKECANASIEFESAMAGVAKTTDMTTAELETMGDQIKALSVKIPVTATELAAIAENAGQLGVAKESIIEFTTVMANLSVATNLTSEEAATMLAQFANVTKLPQNEYSNLGSTIVALGNNFATNERKIVEMAQRLAAAGTIAGMTEQDILALATAISSVGIEAEAGATAMTQTISKFEEAVATGGAMLEDFATVAGMSAGEFAATWNKEPVKAIKAFIDGLARMEERGESSTLILNELDMSGVRQKNTLLSLSQASGLLLDALYLANSAWKEDAALTKESATRYATTESKIKILNNSFNNLKITIGSSFTKAVANSSDMLSTKLDKAGKKVEGFMNRMFDGPDKAKKWYKKAAEGVNTLEEAQALLSETTAEYTRRQEALNNGSEENVATLFAYKNLVSQAESAVRALSAAEQDGSDHAREMFDAHVSAASGLSEAEVAVESLKGEYESLTEAYNKSYAGVHDSINGTLGFFKEIKNEYDRTSDDLLKGWGSQIEFLQKYDEMLQMCKDKGVDEGLLNELLDGTEADAEVLAILTRASSERIHGPGGINETWNLLEKESGDLTETLVKEKLNYTETISNIQAETETLISAMNDSVEDFDAAPIIDELYGILDAIGTVNRTSVRVNWESENSAKPNGSHSSGLGRVPFDGYIAELHRDEMVLTAHEAQAFRAAASVFAPHHQNTPVTKSYTSSPVINIYSSTGSPKAIAEEVSRRIATMSKREAGAYA